MREREVGEVVVASGERCREDVAVEAARLQVHRVVGVAVELSSTSFMPPHSGVEPSAIGPSAAREVASTRECTHAAVLVSIASARRAREDVLVE